MAGSDQKVRLKHLAPGETHQYIDSVVMPKNVTGLVRIKARVIELSYDYEILRYREHGGNSAANGNNEYFAETTGGSTTVNYAHHVIEGSLVQDGDFGILTLNLRNENPDQMDMALKVYGDDKLLMTKTCSDIPEGLMPLSDEDMQSLRAYALQQLQIIAYKKQLDVWRADCNIVLHPELIELGE